MLSMHASLEKAAKPRTQSQKPVGYAEFGHALLIEYCTHIT